MVIGFIMTVMVWYGVHGELCWMGRLITVTENAAPKEQPGPLDNDDLWDTESQRFIEFQPLLTQFGVSKIE